ncbi:MAG: ribosome silencing factor [Gammaproteobacteria bacterium]
MQEKQTQSGNETAAVQADELLAITLAALEDMKAVDVRVIDVSELTTITDYMVVASGTSTRHLKAIADNVALEAKQHGVPALGVEGDKGAEWILIDLADVVVHVMLPEIRAFYALEKLWSVGSGDQTQQDAEP